MNKLFESVWYSLPQGKRIKEQIMGFPRREKVVDLGCGTGASTHYLSSIAGQVVGVDIDGEKVKVAGKRYPGIKFYCMDAGRTDFSDGEFDTAFMVMFLHEAYSDLLIREACRIAREVVIIDYSRILYGFSGRLIKYIEKQKHEEYAGLNLKLIFLDCGYLQKESRSIYSNFFMHIFVRSKGPKANVVNLVQNR